MGSARHFNAGSTNAGEHNAEDLDAGEHNTGTLDAGNLDPANLDATTLDPADRDPENPAPADPQPTIGTAGDVAAYAAVVASAEPTPGGGSVVGVVGALGAALGEMVCRLTLGQHEDASAEPELRSLLARLSDIRERLLTLAAADEAAYRGYREATRLPKGSERERHSRRAALHAALLAATDVPLAVAETCAALAAALEPVARRGTRHAVSDALTGALLAEAALRGALLNVRGNATLLRDDDAAAHYRRRADEIEAAGRAAAARVFAAAE